MRSRSVPVWVMVFATTPTLVIALSSAHPLTPAPRVPAKRVIPLTPSVAIRLNQIGYLPREPKIAVVECAADLAGQRFAVVTAAGGARAFYRGVLGRDRGPYGSFAHHNPADFSGLARPGAYRLRLAGGRGSPQFRIGAGLYRDLPRLILEFFRVQRCGDSAALGHAPCHLTDAIAASGPETGQSIDLSGGWHDAGDYLKFTTTISYATLLLLECADRYGTTGGRGGYPPHRPVPPSAMLNEARLGVTWLLKLHPTPDGFYFQVGSEGEHEVWRRPEADDAEPVKGLHPRPAYFGAGANVAGRCAAALALAARLYRSTDPALAHRCAATAVIFYQCGLRHRGVLTTQPADFYPEASWEGDMALAAEHLYRLTGRKSYLRDALRFAGAAGPSAGAVSLYSIRGLARAELLPLAPRRMRKRLLESLRSGCDQARACARNPFHLAVELTWGTAGRACGAGSLCLLAAPLLHATSLRDLAREQRDYLLGCNPFGVSFLIGAGQRYPRHPHHPLAEIASLPLVGAVVGGPAPTALWMAQPMQEGLGNEATPDDPGVESATAIYHDDVGDWVTNEPALDYAADALFLLAAYAGPGAGR